MGIKEEFPQLKAALLLRSPFLASLLMRARIILTDKVPQMAVTDNYLILVNKKFVESLKFEDKVFLLCHQVMHLALKHVNRPGLNHLKWTIACDAVVNKLVMEMINPSTWLKERLITMNDVLRLFDAYNINVSREDVEKMSAEEIYSLLPDDADIDIDVFLQDLPMQTQDSTNQGNGSSSTTDTSSDTASAGRDEVLQEGDTEIYGDESKLNAKLSLNEKARMEDLWKDALIKSYMMQKTAGKVPGYLQLTVNRILEPKISWNILLREAVRYGYGRTLISTYKKPSRKHDSLPGHARYTIPDVYIMLDTSGSIDKYMLEQFLSEIYAIAKLSAVHVIPWDATVYKPIKATSPREVINKLAPNLRGGGGTVIYDALVYVNAQMKMRDIVIILTDGIISDLDEPNTQMLFDDIATKASAAIFVSTHNVVNIPKWRFTKLSPLDKTVR